VLLFVSLKIRTESKRERERVCVCGRARESLSHSLASSLILAPSLPFSVNPLLHNSLALVGPKIRGERQDDDEEEYREKQPGEGRVGALGDLLAGLC
jgi:hypothetical protein